ncbi:hypothetical protein LZ554_000890 [Drepanopeziza brunnea f. sp. 'monogermtubi']|nr:hypothetical protein LZ554_000890 [Drepanopeziza brunnea f. sp. 'monogermtubi']
MSVGLFIAQALGAFETKNQDLDEQRISSNASPTDHGPPPAKSPPLALRPTTTASPTPTAESAQALRDRLAAEEAATHNVTQICPGCAMRVYKVGGCNHISCQYCCGSLSPQAFRFPRRPKPDAPRNRARRKTKMNRHVRNVFLLP